MISENAEAGSAAAEESGSPEPARDNRLLGSWIGVAAGSGAGIGAGVGAVFGDAGTGAGVGAGVGALIGVVIGSWGSKRGFKGRNC